ncbi:MAG TPA: SUMF1/EgtB/PvdO family nonheme iron enzyme [Archangium sp.]|jgi:formylglycine-generating enzyme required for sulfatase activity|uniref:formylglycine-generating enzyme family protein n=1 Tax=Archangium sp. TaxID=1872627 RepID=UPI002EDA55D8
MHPDIESGSMLLIPAGTFRMGSQESSNEGPVREVHLSAYYIDRFPVTNRQYRAFIEAEGYRTKRYWTAAGWELIQARGIHQPLYWNDPHWNAEAQPVTGLNWWEARAYARFVGKTLPTEAQWECAARGRDGRRFPWGEAEPTPAHANYAVDCDPTELLRSATPVSACLAGASPWGCMDMAGNVGEWCLDNASANYLWDLTHTDPLFWTGEEADHIVRGGSGLHNEDYLRCSSRDYYPPTLRDNLVGLRCVLTLEEP